MRHFSFATLFFVLVALPGLAAAQVSDLDTWIDTDFDGLPDGAPSTMAVGAIDSFAIYVDPTGFPLSTWTNFLYYFQLGPAGTDTSTNFFDNDTADVSVRFVISGGSLYPEDNFSSPYAFGLGGNGFNNSTTGGSFLLAVVGVRAIRVANPTAACIAPLVDPYNPTYTFCQFGNTSSFGTFETGTVTSGCFTVTGGPSAAEPISWGKVKGLFR